MILNYVISILSMYLVGQLGRTLAAAVSLNLQELQIVVALVALKRIYHAKLTIVPIMRIVHAMQTMLMSVHVVQLVTVMIQSVIPTLRVNILLDDIHPIITQATSRAKISSLWLFIILNHYLHLSTSYYKNHSAPSTLVTYPSILFLGLLLY